MKKPSLRYRLARNAYKASRGSDNPEFLQTTPHWFDADADGRRRFFDLWLEYQSDDQNLSDPNRVLQFMYLLETANAAPPGDYIELGTHRGVSARVIHRLMDPTRTLYLLDTFEGFAEKDIKVEQQLYKSKWHVGNFPPTSEEGVLKYVGGGSPPANVKTIKGWFPDAFKGLEDKDWRFVHIDFDLYQPIKAALEICWPKLVPGGVMIVHDCGNFAFPGAKQAVVEFSEKIGLIPTNLADRWGSLALVRPRKPVA